ncbi:MAG: PAS domain S-box protein, partial [Promethearchaeota archaeon]
EMSLIAKDGHSIPYEYSATTLEDSDGKTLIVSVGRDLTERKIAEEALKESEEKFRTLTEQSFLGIAILQDNIVKYTNNQLAQMFGYTVEEIMNWEAGEFLNVIHPEDREMVAAQARKKQLGESDSITQYQFRGIKKNGDNIWLEIYSKSFIYGGKLADFATFHDITEKRVFETKLLESEEKFRSIFETIPDLFFLVSGDTTILEYKGNIEDLYLPPEEFLGKKIIDLVPRHVAKLSLEATKKTLETQKSHTIEYHLEMNGNIHFYEARYLFFAEDRIIIFIRDITERKKIEKQIFGLSKFPSENPNPVLRVDKEKILYINKAGHTLLNIIEGSKIPEFFKAKINQAFAYETMKNFEFVINDKIYLFNIAPITQEGYTNIYGRDVTERKKAEERIKESEENFRALYEEAPIAYFSIGKDQSILRSNKAAERLLGYTKEGFKNMKVVDLYATTEHGLEMAQIFFNQFINGVEIQDQELQMKKKNGDNIWISLSVKPLLDAEGKVTESRSMVMDINKRKLAEKALKKSENKYREAFDRANFYKDLFAHDMNNILQVVNSSAELISFQLGDSEKSKDLDNITKIIKKQVERGSKLISNVLTLSELEEKEIIMKKFEIREFINNAVQFVKRAYSERKLQISVDYNNGRYFINTNELLQDVFENILINGLKYNENLRVEISVRVSKQIIDEKKYIKIELVDNGIGVIDAKKDIIFMKGNRKLKGSKGMGLGLSLVGKILNIFNGKIWVEDRVKGDYSKGSKFIVILPEA